MRLNKSIKNTISELSLEFIAIVSGLILPRLILYRFGSSYNGLLSSVSQFISITALLKSGINSVTRAALYKPLSVNNLEHINSILNASRLFFKKIAFIFLSILILLSGLYPLLVRDEFDYLFTASLIIIVGISSFFQYFFGATYQTLLQADQRGYVYTILQIGTVVFNLIISVILLELNFNIHIVKLGSALIYILNPLFLYWHVQRHYKLDKTVAPNMLLIGQRWDALGHQLATFIHANTDIVVLTIFTTTATVSIYNVYYMAVIVIRKLMTSLSSGVEAALGDILVSENKDYFRKVFGDYEFIIYLFSTILYSVTLLMIIPFVKLYTHGIKDAEYTQPLFAFILVISEYFNCIRVPYQTVANADGQYKNTKKYAYMEAILNITISVVAVNLLGLVGVAIGTAVAMIFRTISYIVFSSNRIIERKPMIAWKNLLASIINIMFIVTVGTLVTSLLDFVIEDWVLWIIMGVVYTITSTLVAFVYAILFKRKEMKGFHQIVKYFYKKVR